MHGRVLVLLDGSPEAEQALPQAVARARADAAELRLLQVVRPRLPVRRGRWSRAAERAAWLYLDTVAQRLQSEGLTVTYQVRRGVLNPIVAEVARADMLFVATRTARLLGWLVGGSVRANPLLRLPCPLLLVPSQAETAGGRVRSFADDARQHETLAQRPLGTRSVAVDRIVGSVGRAHELRSDFMPVWREPGYARGDDRYRRVRKAMEEGQFLPPIELYKLGERYYVLDGNHRVAAARALGCTELDAFVMEFLPVQDTDARQVFVERRSFEQATGLSLLDATRPGHYPRLEAMIRAYAESEGIDLQKAAQRWYRRVYSPVADSLEAVQLDNLFPGERSADLFVHLAELRSAEEEFLGRPISWDEAVETMLVRYRSCQRHARLRLPELRRLLRPSES